MKILRTADDVLFELTSQLSFVRFEIETFLKRNDELEAEVARLESKIAELEAERDKLLEQVRYFTADLKDSTLSVGEAYRSRSENHGPGKKP